MSTISPIMFSGHRKRCKIKATTRMLAFIGPMRRFRRGVAARTHEWAHKGIIGSRKTP